jgi:hypothetical protein
MITTANTPEAIPERVNNSPQLELELVPSKHGTLSIANSNNKKSLKLGKKVSKFLQISLI